jgi:hypothetical protein
MCSRRCTEERVPPTRHRGIRARPPAEGERA